MSKGKERSALLVFSLLIGFFVGLVKGRESHGREVVNINQCHLTGPHWTTEDGELCGCTIGYVETASGECVPEPGGGGGGGGGGGTNPDSDNDCPGGPPCGGGGGGGQQPQPPSPQCTACQRAITSASRMPRGGKKTV